MKTKLLKRCLPWIEYAKNEVDQLAKTKRFRGDKCLKEESQNLERLIRDIKNEL